MNNDNFNGEDNVNINIPPNLDSPAMDSNINPIPQQPSINNKAVVANEPALSPTINETPSIDNMAQQDNIPVTPTIVQPVSPILHTEVNEAEQPCVVPSQPTVAPVLGDDEELLKAFIGKNYDKITTRKFNFAALCWASSYFIYRKMVLLSVIVCSLGTLVMLVTSKLNSTLSLIVSLSFILILMILSGSLTNKYYLDFAKRKIAKIKQKNPQTDLNGLKVLCAKKGGTNVANVFVLIVICLLINISLLFYIVKSNIENFFNSNNSTSAISDNTGNYSTSKKGTLLEDVIVTGHFCFGTSCTVTIESKENTEDYTLKANNIELFVSLDDYSEYVKLNIYYTKKGDEKTIVDYKIFTKSDMKEIVDIQTEADLRTKLGLYLIGTHTETFTLTEIGTSGSGEEDDRKYDYVDYILTDANNTKYEMQYKDFDNTPLNLVAGTEYNITFEVVEGTFGYEFYIKSVN